MLSSGASDKVATPDAFVDAVPTEVLLSEKEIVCPLTPDPPEVRVACRLLVPPYWPVAGWIVSVVAAMFITVRVMPVLSELM